MGSEISVPLGASVLAYNDTGATKNFGDQVYGDQLKASYVPGSYPYKYTFVPTQLFECRGYSPATTTTHLGTELKKGTTTLWVRVA